MHTLSIPKNYDHTSPAGAEIRVLMNNAHGSIVHCTLKKGIVSKAVCHQRVSEFWHILSGKGAIWRRNKTDELITPLSVGVTIDIPVHTDFQYRSDEEDLVFICVTMPPWSGPDEAIYIEKGAWEMLSYLL